RQHQGDSNQFITYFGGNSMAEPILTAARVLELFRYERETGKFYWIVDGRIKKLIGKEAGMSGHKGAKILHVDGVRYGAEKIVWMLEHGSFPSFRIGYADGCPGNTAISNLIPLKRAKFTKESI